jgi:hypothetical protein
LWRAISRPIGFEGIHDVLEAAKHCDQEHGVRKVLEHRDFPQSHPTASTALFRGRVNRLASASGPMLCSAMEPTVTTLERAFALAKSGECTSVQAIRKRLIQEGYSVTQITGQALSKQLLALMRAAQGESHA